MIILNDNEKSLKNKILELEINLLLNDRVVKPFPQAIYLDIKKRQIYIENNHKKYSTLLKSNNSILMKKMVSDFENAVRLNSEKIVDELDDVVEGNSAVLNGYDPKKYYKGRASIEAASLGVSVGDGEAVEFFDEDAEQADQPAEGRGNNDARGR